MTGDLIVGLAISYAPFALLPLIVIGVPAVFTLKIKRISGLPATTILTVGGAVVGGLLMKMTFGEFEGFGAIVRDGMIVGGSIGLLLGVFLFPRLPAVKA